MANNNPIIHHHPLRGVVLFMLLFFSMQLTTLCFCLREEDVLLGMKKRGFGAGKWNGYGGKVLEGETTKVAALRELKEESGLEATEDALRHVAVLRFFFDGNPIFECHVFILHTWQGQAIETEEMAPRWFPMQELPLTDMWAADGKWLPLILEGKSLEADVNFNTDGSALKEFSYQEKRFG